MSIWAAAVLFCEDVMSQKEVHTRDWKDDSFAPALDRLDRQEWLNELFSLRRRPE